MMSPGHWLWTAIAAVLICGAVIRQRYFQSRVSYAAGVLAAGMYASAAAVFAYSSGRPVQIVQHESAARLCDRIKRHFHRKEWIIVSPFQELAFTYGLGWHVELSEFVSQFTMDQVSDPGFTLPYDCPDVFFFVERKPISPGARPGGHGVVWRYSPAESADWSAFLYTDPVGRSSLEYRAAMLLAAYTRHHRNMSVFYEDEDLVVFRMVRSVAEPQAIARVR
jgi:hypothetical protein